MPFLQSEPITSSAKDGTAKNRRNRIRAVRGLLSLMLVHAILPLLIFLLMKNEFHQSQFLSLLATSAPSMLMSLLGIVHKRRFDFWANMVLLGIGVGLIVTLVSNDPRLLLIRDSFFTTAFGLAFLLSLLFPKPLIYYTRSFLHAHDPEQAQQYAMRWQMDRSWRIKMRAQTFIWGLGLLLEAAVRVPLVFILPAGQFLIISPFAQWGIIGATFVVSQFSVRVLSEFGRRLVVVIVCEVFS